VDAVAPLSGLRVVVAGAGAMGLVVALRLRDDGAEVILADPAQLGANASGVAAGMLAPAFEAALDPLSAGHFELMKYARDFWPGLVERLAEFGAGLDRSGAMWVGDAESNGRVAATLDGLGAQSEQLTAVAAERLSPGLSAPAGAVFTPEDWTLDPARMLAALSAAFAAAGGDMRRAGVRAWSGAAVSLSDGEEVRADALVLATGLAPAGMIGAPPETARLEPIKGQITQLTTEAARGGPAVRGAGVYVVPRASGPIVGATMEPGVRNLDIEPATIARLKSAAGRLFPALADAEATGAAGIRASTPDGLPLVGTSGTAETWLAMGARRNGWLLAPLAAEMLADQLVGGAGGRWAAGFEPGRFGGVS
jgi:glycine oxidase